ncbi:MAG: hypothetical protein ACRC6V_03705 [Bacteroidales bacterium]
MSKKKTIDDACFSLDSKDLVKAIDQILAIIPNSPMSTYRLTVEDEIVLSATKDDTYCRVVVPGKAISSTSMYFSDDSLVQLKTLIKNRGTMDFTNNTHEVAFKSGRYSGTLKLNGSVSSHCDAIFAKFSAIKLSKKQMLSMKDGFFSTVNNAVAATRIVNSFYEGYISTALIEYKKNILTVLTFDDWHIHFFEAKVKSDTPDLRITIPTAVFGILEKVIKGGKTHMYVDSDMFALKTEDLFIILPPMQEIEAERYIEFMNNLPKIACKVKCNSTLGAALDNISGLIKQDGNKRLNLKLTAKGGTLSYANTNGSVSDKFKIDAFKGDDVQLGLDYPIFSDTFKAIKHTEAFTVNVHVNSENTPSLYSMKGEMLGGTLSVMGHVSE